MSGGQYSNGIKNQYRWGVRGTRWRSDGCFDSYGATAAAEGSGTKYTADDHGRSIDGEWGSSGSVGVAYN